MKNLIRSLRWRFPSFGKKNFANSSEFNLHFTRSRYFPKNFYLIEAVNEQISRLQTSGLIEYWTYKQHLDNQLINMRNNEVGPTTINMHHLEIAFQIWGAGCLLAFVVFAFEVLSVSLKKILGRKLRICWQKVNRSNK